MSPVALRSLLLAGPLSVSTQHALTPPAKAAPQRAALTVALWAWVVAVASVAVVAWLGGGARGAIAGAAALAFAPAWAGFLLLPRLGRQPVDAGFIAVWVVTITGLVAGTGGALSPLASAFAIPPALALMLGRRWAPEAGAAAVLGYAAAAWLAAPRPAELGPFPEMMSVVALAFAAALMALGQRAPAREEQMGRRIAEVSHELRTPLTHILGFSEMIERKIFGEVSERYVEYAGLIRRSGNHLLGLVNDLLDLSKLDAGKFELERERFDVRTVVEEIVRLSVDAAEKKQIALGMVTGDAALLVDADARAVKRMLINTLSNAIKFTPEGGRVMITAAASGGALVLETIDNGPGISDEEKRKLGQEFVRGAAKGEGTGLGLALVRGLAALHDGSLSFHDAPGGGALVRITLPVLADQSASAR